MGSKSDWETMRHADEMLTRFGVPHECRIVSAHRTPALMAQFASEAEARGLQVIIAGAGGAAHLPGMVAAQTTVPVLGVPVQSQALSGLDSLLSIVQMPGGIPVGTLAIGKAGATNAALLAVAILANHDPALRDELRRFPPNRPKRCWGTRSMTSKPSPPAPSNWARGSKRPPCLTLSQVWERAWELPGLLPSSPARRSASSAAGSWAGCSPWPPAAWATVSTPFPPTTTRRPGRSRTWKWSPIMMTWTPCAPLPGTSRS